MQKFLVRFAQGARQDYSTEEIPPPPNFHSMFGPCLLLCTLAAAQSADVQQRISLAAARNSMTQASHRSGSGEDKPKPKAWSALHDVVGRDGVLMIHLKRDGELDETSKLSEVGILPTMFPAVNGHTASSDELRQGCISADEPDNTCPKTDVGCVTTTEQAIAESHRQALLAAQKRNATWTAIFEDDVVALDPVNFNENFKELWRNVPESMRMVRLGWCSLSKAATTSSINTFANHNGFRLVDRQNLQDGRYYAGGCAHAYMVHRDAIPAMLAAFPCCISLDACYEYQVYYQPSSCRSQTDGRPQCWGEKYMMGMDTWGSESWTKGWTTFSQNGILVQDNRKTHSSRHY